MSDVLAVLLDDTVAGSITRLSQARLRLDYEDQYRERPRATPLSVSMPPAIRSHPDGEISPWLAGLLPDNERVLARWARDFQVSPRPFSLLSTPIGRDCAGAVRFAPAEEALDVLEGPGTVTWLTEEEVAQRLRELREDSTAWLGGKSTGQFSLAGAQSKTALLFEDGRWGVPAGSAATSHILKPAVEGLDDHDLNEHICLDAAARAGLIVARTRVERFGDETAIVVERYDRRMVDGELVRIHQEDTCQALGRFPEQKYENDGGPSASDLAELFRAVMPRRAAESAVRRFLDALIWNWLIGGTDAHAKNYSLLLDGGDVRLAPLYDVASVLPYGMHERELRFAMKIGGDYDVFPQRNTWGKAAADLGLVADEVLARVAGLTLIAADALADAANAPDVVALNRPLPRRLVDLVADRAQRCLAVLPQAATARATQTARYEERVAELSDAVPPQAVALDGAPVLVEEAARALRDAVSTQPRDLSVVRERIFQLGVAALRVVQAIGEAETPPGYVNPTRSRLPGLVRDFAPDVANLPIGQDDPVGRVADEIIRTAERFLQADPRSIFGTASERALALYRVVGLAARALSL